MDFELSDLWVAYARGAREAAALGQPINEHLIQRAADAYCKLVWHERAVHMKEVLYFGASWCRACQAKGPLVEQTCREYAVPLTSYDIDQDGKDLAEAYGFKVIPAVVVLEAGVPTYRASSGLINHDALAQRLQ